MRFNIFIKKTFLIFIGLILSVLFLEIFLQSTSFIIKSINSYKIQTHFEKLKNKTSFKIMCIGESTTANQYPIQLQKILDKVSPGKFSVIDCGIPGTFLDEIYHSLQSNMKEYNPDMVIFMMGINNMLYWQETYDINQIECLNKTKIKIYKLFLLLKMHISSLTMAKTSSVNVEKFEFHRYQKTDIPAYIFKQISDLEAQGKFKELSITLENLFKKYPKNEYIYSKLVQLYCDYLNDEKYSDKGYNMAIKGINYDFIRRKEILYKIIFERNFRQNNLSILKLYTSKAIEESPEIFKTDCSFFIYGFIKNVITEEQKNKILKILKGTLYSDKYYGVLAIELLQKGNYGQADKYFKLAEELRLKFPDEKSYNIYKLILKKVDDCGIKVICMQYPIRSIETLKEILKNEPYFNKITFISNEKLFKNMLKKYSYNTIFMDQFGGDFGHCTELGNTMIAKNLAKEIVEIINK